MKPFGLAGILWIYFGRIRRMKCLEFGFVFWVCPNATLMERFHETLLMFCSAVTDLSQAWTMSEYITADSDRTAGKGDAGQFAAANERIAANVGHAVRNGDAGQAGAARECILRYWSRVWGW